MKVYIGQSVQFKPKTPKAISEIWEIHHINNDGSCMLTRKAPVGYFYVFRVTPKDIEKFYHSPKR